MATSAGRVRTHSVAAAREAKEKKGTVGDAHAGRPVAQHGDRDTHRTDHEGETEQPDRHVAQLRQIGPSAAVARRRMPT